MEDTDSYTTRPHRLVGSTDNPNHGNPSKFYPYFLYKAVLVAIFLVFLPLFPSQPPEFINQTLLTRSWELLQLRFVGIAVSYGLFSRPNDETYKEYGSNFANAESYVSRLLQVSSGFDDETENPSGYDENNKVQTWNSQYYGGEAVIVVAPESSLLHERRSTNSQTVEKPILLPVRRLKSLVSDSDINESADESGGKICSHNKPASNSGSKCFSSSANLPRNGEFGGSSPLDPKEKAEDNVVLRSPIPWRSRSGRTEMKEDGEDGPPPYSLPPSIEDSEFNLAESRSFKSQSSSFSRHNSSSSSPKNLSPSPSLSSPKNPYSSPVFSLESQAKNAEDLVGIKVFHKSSPPPPPPPPLLRKSEYPPLSRANSGAQSRPKTQNERSIVGKSVRTIRPNERVLGGMRAREVDEIRNGKAEKRSKEEEANSPEILGRTDGFVHESLPDMTKQIFMGEFPKDEKKESVDTDKEDFDSFKGRSSNTEEVEEVGSKCLGNEGPDVDKKADEFIAKFREQIRLQRIASIRRSAGQIK